MSSQAIGIFDSGVGGLTVMQKVMETLPRERLIYFGDTARVPYGNKSREAIIRYCIENTAFLMEKNIKLLIVACSTASAVALPILQQEFCIPIIGMIDPGAAEAASFTRDQRIAVLGTKRTIQSGAYQAALIKHMPQAAIFPIACPLFVPLVEEQSTKHPAARLIVQEYLRPLHAQRIDTVVLGCTHYPLLRSLIQEEMGEHISLIDSASASAAAVAHLLQQQQLLSPVLESPHDYYVSDDPEAFSSFGEQLFGASLGHVNLISFDKSKSKQ